MDDRLLSPEEAAEMNEWFAKGEPSDRELWKAMYGFDHDCHCELDMEEGKTETVPACYLSMVDDAMPKLAEARDVLRAIANGSFNDIRLVEALAREALKV